MCSHQLSLTCEKRGLKSFFCTMCRYFSCFSVSVVTDKFSLFLHPLDAKNVHIFLSIHFIEASLDPLSLETLHFSFGNAREILYVFLDLSLLFATLCSLFLILKFPPPKKNRKKINPNRKIKKKKRKSVRQNVLK